MRIVLRSGVAFAWLALSACALSTAEGDGSETTHAALAATSHPGPNYVIEKQTFDMGQPKVLDGFALQGAKALLETWDTTTFPPGQTWTLSDTGELKSAEKPGLCLDVRGGDLRAGVAVQSWGCNGQPNQKWYVEADQPGGRQFGVIRPVGHPDLCLDAKGQSTANATVLQLWTCNGQSNQRWALFSAG